MTKMKAVICTKYGDPSVLKVEQINKPKTNNNAVLVKVHTTAATASDCVIRGLNMPGGHKFPVKQLMTFAMRLFLGFFKPRNPVLGLVFSGIIEEVGDNIKGFKVGDEVFGFTGNSRASYAEYKIVSAKEIKAGEMILKPKYLLHEEATAIVYGGVLAVHFMRDMDIKAKQKVLIYGASGAIGTIAIQLAKAAGAEVTAVCSTCNFELVASLGATKMIDYTKENAIQALEKYDYILDAVGKNKVSELKIAAKKALNTTGKYVSVDDGLLKVEPDYLPKIANLAEKGELQAIIDKIYVLDNIVKAHQYVETGHKRGNVVVIVE